MLKYIGKQRYAMIIKSSKRRISVREGDVVTDKYPSLTKEEIKQILKMNDNKEFKGKFVEEKETKDKKPKEGGD